jgi:hypothetical protein
VHTLGGVQLSDKEKLYGWRLLSLIDAYRTQKEPLDLEDMELLGRIARARTDLHEACSALLSGCRLEYAVILYTDLA